jgi:hypothetical protein
MTFKDNRSREQKLSLIRSHLHRIRDRRFQRECADLIRAIRYLRLRNQELATLDFLVRLQDSIRQISINSSRISEPPESTVDTFLDSRPLQGSPR